MKRESSTATTGVFKGVRTSTKNLIAKMEKLRADIKDPKRSKLEGFHQMDCEQLGRFDYEMKKRAHAGDKEAAAFYAKKVKK